MVRIMSNGSDVYHVLTCLLPTFRSSKSTSRNTGDEEPSRTVASATIVIFLLESGFLYGLFWVGGYLQ